jgi:hypothetical protein
LPVLQPSHGLQDCHPSSEKIHVGLLILSGSLYKARQILLIADGNSGVMLAL